MDDIEKNILNEIQSDFPLSKRPYLDVGKRLGLAEEKVITAVARLKEKGIIRRIGANFHSDRLNHVSTLCAARVPEEKIASFVEVVNSYTGVTHNYLRNGPYNIWFTFIAKDMNTIDEALEAIAHKTGVNDILNLPARKIFKIKVDFEV